MLPSTAQMWTWASVSPGMRVAPRRSSVVIGPASGPTFPLGRTSLMRSSSTTTAAPSTGSAPVQSISSALVRTVTLMRAGSARTAHLVGGLREEHGASSRDDLRVVHPYLLVGARRPLDVARDAVEVVLLPEGHPRRLVVRELLQLRVRRGARLRVYQRDRPRDLRVDGRVVAVGRVGLVRLEERLDHALAEERRPPAEEERVARVPVLDLVEVRAPLVHDDVDRDPEPLELGGDRERNVLVERVAARRGVERELELRRVVAGLAQQGHGARRVVLVALDRGVVQLRLRQRAAVRWRAPLQHL